ncbi:conjugal transfer protein TraF [Candidatus Tisiphia endosymbiont of Thecophora atra]|uniref:conjugal transfer protein TraF n=1 Tax=Candidatus Tisiphia endosymbiont of Thecophora atra TaxID=3066258 RepID=UPI00312CA86A
MIKKFGRIILFRILHMVNQLAYFLLILLTVIPIVIASSCYAQGFFEQRYRGWLWFEERELAKELEKQQETLVIEQQREQEYAKARQEVEQFSKELEELKFMMIRYPENIKHVRRYKEKEASMLDNSLKLAHSFRMVNFLYPETINLIENPINLYGRRIKEETDQQKLASKLKILATQIELFVFFSSNCPYCIALEPVLNDFAKKYGFKVEAVSLDGSKSKFFKTYQNQELAGKLNLQRTPTIVAVTNDSKIHFELIRGTASMSELEEAGLLASEYLSNYPNNTENILKVTENGN